MTCGIPNSVRCQRRTRVLRSTVCAARCFPAPSRPPSGFPRVDLISSRSKRECQRQPPLCANVCHTFNTQIQLPHRMNQALNIDNVEPWTICANIGFVWYAVTVMQSARLPLSQYKENPCLETQTDADTECQASHNKAWVRRCSETHCLQRSRDETGRHKGSKTHDYTSTIPARVARNDSMIATTDRGGGTTALAPWL